MERRFIRLINFLRAYPQLDFMAWKKSEFPHSQTFRFFAHGALSLNLGQTQSRAKNYLRHI
jgi:hypothetical protein